MARSVSVPLLLLLPLLLFSALAAVYEPLAGITQVDHQSMLSPVAKSSASECADVCDASRYCTAGYLYENGQCQGYVADCRGPGAIGEPAPENYMARNDCPGENSQYLLYPPPYSTILILSISSP